MRVRLAGVSDLIAAEGKYHKKCLAAYKYQTGKNKEESKKTDIALIFKQNHQERILSLTQDIVYAVSNGVKWTPKHIGLGSTLHQVTRSKQLVDLFHKAGNILSYKQILKIDTALTQETPASMKNDNGAVVPPNLNAAIFTHFTADNIDINDSSLDGKNTFHAIQVAAWQRTRNNRTLDTLKTFCQNVLGNSRSDATIRCSQCCGR